MGRVADAVVEVEGEDAFGIEDRGRFLVGGFGDGEDSKIEILGPGFGFGFGDGKGVVLLEEVAIDFISEL